MRKTRTKLILWFLSIIGLTAIIIVFSINKSLVYQFENFLTSTSDGQVNTMEAFVVDGYNERGWTDEFKVRLTDLAEAGDMSVKLTDSEYNVLVDFEYRDEWMMRRRQMPMHMHDDSGEEFGGKFNGFWPTNIIRTLKDQSGKEIGILEIEIHALDSAMGPAMDFKRNMTRSIVKAVLIAAGLSVILGMTFARTFSRPLNLMTKVAEKMKTGALDQRVETKQSTEEMKQLAQALNHLSDSLARQQKLRSRLASDLSHELRTPLSVIKSHIEAIRDGIWTLEDSHIDILLHETERLMNLADQVRYIEDIESHHITLSLTDVDMKEYLQSMVEYFLPDVRRQNKRIEIHGLLQHKVSIDPDKFRQILINLVANALQHTASGDLISLNLSEQNNNAVLEIIDTGCGIKPEAIEHIFERLYRSEDARSRVDGGSGLGLSVVKSLVEAHGWEIQVESQLDNGTIMRVIMIK